jgi:LysR family cyn operon transcriptional activator
MNIQHLRYLIAIAHTGGFTAASRELHVTQPTVSGGITELERQLRAKLFNRDSRHVTLTSEGRVLLEYAIEIVDLVEEATGRLASGEVLPGERVRFGAIDVAVIYLLPDLLKEFSHNFPGVELTTQVASSVPLVDDVLSSRSEFAVVSLPLSHTRIEVVPLTSDAMVLVVNPEHRFTRRAWVSVAEVVEEALIMFQGESVSRQIVEEGFAQQGFTVRASMEMSSPDAIRKLVEAGAGVSFLPRMTVADSVAAGALEEVRVRNLDMTREVGLVWRQGRHFSPAARRLLEAILAKFDRVADWPRLEAGVMRRRGKG